jgi:predicted ATPase
LDRPDLARAARPHRQAGPQPAGAADRYLPPEFQPPWTGEPQALNRLDRGDRAALLEQIAGGKALPNEVVAQIAARTDGGPLFVEELTKSVLDSGLLHEKADCYVLRWGIAPVCAPDEFARLAGRQRTMPRASL